MLQVIFVFAYDEPRLEVRSPFAGSFDERACSRAECMDERVYTNKTQAMVKAAPGAINFRGFIL